MDDFGTNVNLAYAGNVLAEFYASSVADSITNRDYEVLVQTEQTLTVKILTIEVPDHVTYDGTAKSAAKPQESEAIFTSDQKKLNYFNIDDLVAFESYAKDPESSLIKERALKLKELIDTYILSFWEDAASGHWIGVVYDTGTVTITTGTGAVAGSGTTFTSGMVGKPFKAVGHTSWYRVKTFTNTTSIVIEDDLDDESSAYTGGSIGGGATYEIQANTPALLLKATIFDALADANQLLDDAKVPMEGRWGVFPPRFFRILKQAPEVIPAVAEAYSTVTKKGIIGELDGMILYKSVFIAGDNTNGYHVLCGHMSAITMAEPFMRTGIENLTDSPSGGLFGKNYKELDIYGAKVADVKRKGLVHIFCTANLT